MVYIPGISKTLVRRKGGGKGKGKGKGKGSGKGSGSKSSSSSKSGKKSPKTTSNLPVGKKSTTLYGNGGGTVSKILSGFFAGRTVGGGTRTTIFGNRKYGSGYPGYPIGVADYGFPYYFWPLSYGRCYLYCAYYIHTDEYGTPDNSTRPGGPMVTSIYASNDQSTMFFFVADNDTATAIVPIIQQNCSSVLNTNVSNTPATYNVNDPSVPKPEQVVQYYRASSAALMLQGYNNTAQLSDNTSLPDTPLPTNIDMNLLTCLNQTIGTALPLVDAAGFSTWNSGVTGSAYTIGSFWLLYYILCDILILF